MRKQLTKRGFDVPKYYCLVWGGGVNAVKNTVQLNYINVSLTSLYTYPGDDFTCET